MWGEGWARGAENRWHLCWTRQPLPVLSSAGHSPGGTYRATPPVPSPFPTPSSSIPTATAMGSPSHPSLSPLKGQSHEARGFD